MKLMFLYSILLFPQFHKKLPSNKYICLIALSFYSSIVIHFDDWSWDTAIEVQEVTKLSTIFATQENS